MHISYTPKIILYVVITTVAIILVFYWGLTQWSRETYSPSPQPTAGEIPRLDYSAADEERW